MKKVSLIVYQNHIEEIIKALHHQGVMQIINILKEEPDTLDEIEQAHMDPEAETIALYELRLTRLIDILKKVKPKQKAINALLSPEILERKIIKERSLHDLYSSAEELFETTENIIIQKEERLQKLDESLETITKDLEKLDHF